MSGRIVGRAQARDISFRSDAGVGEGEGGTQSSYKSVGGGGEDSHRSIDFYCVSRDPINFGRPIMSSPTECFSNFFSGVFAANYIVSELAYSGRTNARL